MTLFIDKKYILLSVALLFNVLIITFIGLCLNTWSHYGFTPSNINDTSGNFYPHMHAETGTYGGFVILAVVNFFIFLIANIEYHWIGVKQND
ncbi:MAG: hypothetical protein KGI05_08515 [Thaumarchaeota archaeon]|nr:hypothetical protein [Nitrososphaerota archaeon]MDE1828630.1 hypothetical protein [Candidatus Micrarchaeota archaeon]